MEEWDDKFAQPFVQGDAELRLSVLLLLRPARLTQSFRRKLMGRATGYIDKLKKGETVQFRSRGNSMSETHRRGPQAFRRPALGLRVSLPPR